LYLRWPRRRVSWRVWLCFDTSLKGRAFLWRLHAVVGTWALLGLLMMSLTGLYWSYDWYRGGLYHLAGMEPPVRGSRPLPAVPAPSPQNRRTALHADGDVRHAPGLDAAWDSFKQEVSRSGFGMATVGLPLLATGPITIRYLGAHPEHERAWNTLTLDAGTGAVIRHQRYADRPAGERLMASIFPLHSGGFFGLPGRFAYMLASLSMVVFAASGWIMYLGRGKKKIAATKARNQTADAIVTAHR
jgi:sulfite reductase (NADPH) flavoprotein alpha-component